jgi:metal-responsive CopG/Arc/MetJ family transcriptional regulator
MDIIASITTYLLMENMMDSLGLDQFETIRTTITLPARLVKRSERFIKEGAAPSRNALIVAALEYFLTELEEQEIDKTFAGMAEDVDYQALNERLAEDFAESDWEALLIEEEGRW